METVKIEGKVRELNGFSDFNPMQKKALKKNTYSKNLVLSAPTASGKTIIAELCALNCIINRKKKVIYTCPLKAIASEHFREFRNRYSKGFGIRIAISTGDLDSSSKYLSKYDLILCTNEKIDSLIRHQAEWLQNVGLLIADEIHELDSGRGATLEMVISKMRFILPKLQVLALSATIPNACEIAEWLDAELVESDFRPVELREGILLDKTIYFQRGEEELPGSEEELSAVIEDTLEKKKQALFFMNTRRNAEGFAKKAARVVENKLLPKEKDYLQKISQRVEGVLESPTEQCKSLASLVRRGTAFHHAGLLPKQRELVEDAFKEGKLKVISATPTLAAGVNLPSFRVVIPSLYRYTKYGMQRIPVREYKQMCLPYNSKIITKEHGELEIGKIVENELKCNVLSFNERKAKLEFEPIKNFFKNDQSSMIAFKTQLGTELRLTPNHSVLVKEENGFVWKKSKNITVGEKVIHQKHINSTFQKSPYFIDLLPKDKVYVKNCGRLITKAKEKLGISEKELSKRLGIKYKISYHYKTDRKAMPFKVVLKLCDILEYSKERRAKLIGEVKTACGESVIIPKFINDDFLWLVGFVATDGNINRCIGKKTKSEYINLRISNTNVHLINKTKAVLMKLGLVPYESRRENRLITLEVGATLICRILKEYFGIPYGNKTTSVKIPEFLMNLSPELIGAYLGGVFDGDGNYKEGFQRYGSKARRVLVVSASKEFAYGIQKLLLRLGILAKVTAKENNSLVTIRNKKVHFSKPVYYIVFCKIEYIKKFQKYAKINKCKINAEYSDYHNIRNFHDKGDNEFGLVEIIDKDNSVYNGPVYNLAVMDNNNYFADNILVHNCGRAGRPRYDACGESIIVARSETEFDELKECYVEGEVERIQSQLAHEPVLRMHLLALIATRFVFDTDSMEKFFSRTFYSLQYGDTAEIMEKLEVIASELGEYGFVEERKGKLVATALGRRVSDLYLDPLSAKRLIDALKKKLSVFSALYAFANTFEFFPLISAPKKREPELWAELLSMESKLPVDVSSEQFFDSSLLDKFNSAMLLNEWIREKSEQQLMEEFNTKPGILFSKLRICDWLAYSALELSRLLELKENMPVLAETRRRLKYGVKKELLPLVELRGIGRVRGRRLYRAGIRSISDLKRVPFADLSRVLGDAVARSVKEQLGQRVKAPGKREKTKTSGQSALSSFR